MFSLFKRAYEVIAMLAVLNMLALAGLGVALVSTGAVTGQKLRRIVAVLRGDESAVTAPAVAGKPSRTKQPAGDASSPVANQAADTQTDGEASPLQAGILRLEGKRIQAELDQRLALNNSILLRVMTERERFHQEQEQAARQQKKAFEQRHTEGFQKQISIYEALSPKVALEHLLGLPQPDEAARILLAMKTRKAKKIVETAKRGEQLSKMRVILQRVREVAPDVSEELKPTQP